MKNLEKNYIYPVCPECLKILRIYNLNPINYTLSLECDNGHKKDEIFYCTFNKFYVKNSLVQLIQKCSICSNEEIDTNYYKINEEKNIYCIDCLQRILKNRNVEKIITYNSNICNIHFNEFSEYCLECNKNLCIKCINQEKNSHLNHNRISLGGLLPNKKEIKKLKEKLELKITETKSIIESIKIWKNTIDSLSNQLIDNLEAEIELMNIFIYNYNKNFIDYNNYQNFNKIKDYIGNSLNENLYKFYKSSKLEEKSKFIFSAFKKLGHIKLEKQINLKEQFNLNNVTNLKQIIQYKNNYCLFIDFSNLFIGKIEKNNIIIESNVIPGTFSSAFISYKFNQIITTDNKERKIKIFDFDTLKINDNNIIIQDNYENKVFIKSIKLNNEDIISIDDYYIVIWRKENNYKKLKILELKEISDVIEINNEHILVSNQLDNKIIIYETKNYKETKIINNIDLNKSTDIFNKIEDDFILIRGKNILYIFFSKYFEIVQKIFLKIDIFPTILKIKTDLNGRIFLFKFFSEVIEKKDELLMSFDINNLNKKSYKYVTINKCKIKLLKFSKENKETILLTEKTIKDIDSNQIVSVNNLGDIYIWDYKTMNIYS